jgi:hypothetical protein
MYLAEDLQQTSPQLRSFYYPMSSDPRLLCAEILSILVFIVTSRVFGPGYRTALYFVKPVRRDSSCFCVSVFFELYYAFLRNNQYSRRLIPKLHTIPYHTIPYHHMSIGRPFR